MRFTFPAKVTSHSHNKILGLQFLELSQQQQLALVQCTFARNDAWDGWDKDFEENNSAETLRDILQMSLNGYKVVFRYLHDQFTEKKKLLRFSLKPTKPNQTEPVSHQHLSYQMYREQRSTRQP